MIFVKEYIALKYCCEYVVLKYYSLCFWQLMSIYMEIMCLPTVLAVDGIQVSAKWYSFHQRCGKVNKMNLEDAKPMRIYCEQQMYLK